MSKMNEIILVAPRSAVFVNETLTFQGVNSDKELTKQITDNIASTFSEMRRGDAEENYEYKQPIPYCVLKRGNDVYVYERLKGGGESRLHSKLSLGAGGHMNTNDEIKDFHDLLMDNLKRELEEELYIKSEKVDLEVIGLINDDENEVGKVHIGLLVIAELKEDAEVTVKETDQLKGEWNTVAALKQPEIYERLESWSQFVVDIL